MRAGGISLPLVSLRDLMRLKEYSGRPQDLPGGPEEGGEDEEEGRMKGFRYHVSEEKIGEYMKLTPKQKLEWLEEINRFLHRFMPEESRRIAEKFRAGEI